MTKKVLINSSTRFPQIFTFWCGTYDHPFKSLSKLVTLEVDYFLHILEQKKITKQFKQKTKFFKET